MQASQLWKKSFERIPTILHPAQLREKESNYEESHQTLFQFDELKPVNRSFSLLRNWSLRGGPGRGWGRCRAGWSGSRGRWGCNVGTDPGRCGDEVSTFFMVVIQGVQGVMIYQFRLQSPDPNCNNCIGSIVKVDLCCCFGVFGPWSLWGWSINIPNGSSTGDPGSGDISIQTAESWPYLQ